MKKKNALKVVLLSLVSLVLLLVLVVLFWLGPTVKVIAEGIGSKALGTPVIIEYLSINPRNGTIDLHGFQIGTHEGFSRTNTWELANFHVAIDMRSLFSDTIVIHEIQIDGPHFTYEQNQATDNISELIRSIQAFADIDPDEPKKKKEQRVPDDAPEKKPKKVVVERLEINDLQMHLANTTDPQLDIQFGVEQFSLSLTNGVVQLKQLTLSDPGLLSTPNVFELEAIVVQLDPASIYSDRLVIEDIQVVKPHAFLERNVDTDTVAEFMRLAQTFIDKIGRLSDPEPSSRDLPVPSEAEGESNAEASDTPTEPPPFELHNLFVDDIQLNLLDTTRTNAAHETRTLAAIGGISVRLLDGRIQIKDITIPNPAGFHATNLLHLAGIAITLAPESVFSGQVVINEVFVDSPEINLEQTEATGNVAELQKSLMGFVPPTPETPAPEPEKLPETVATNAPVPLAEQPVILETLIVTNLAVNAILLPPGTTTTNEPATGLLDRVGLNKLNPITYVKKTGTNEMAATEASEIALLAFDLLSIEPLKGTVGISNLRIGNPQGFANEHLVKLQQFKLCLDPDSLLTDTLLIKEIHIEKPRVAYERKITTDNIKTFQQTIEAAFAQREEAMDKAEEQHDVEADVEQKVIIEHLLVQNGIVRAKISALPTAPIPLPTIEMKDVGKKEGGASLGEASSKIFSAFYDSIIGVVANTTGIAGDALKGAGSLTLDTLGNITESIGGLVGKDGKVKTETPEESEPKKKKPRSKRRRIFRR